eukprot:TRINITY_DN14180_c0_g1_i1.p1 TRINITY_DN14180_c0_g1~~TRINITY_DN14180_c0_g1_i1.p1  ORF type:complete len:326 (+),score=89.02 TRINITY_DN14180_c0_g1_i1:43-1020(+)
MATTTVSVNKALHGIVIGKGGCNAKEIKEKTGCTVEVPDRADKSNKVKITGDDKKSVAAAKKMIQAIVADNKKKAKPTKGKDVKETKKKKPTGKDAKGDKKDGAKKTKEMKMAKHYTSFVIGKGGEKLKSIQAESDTRINVDSKNEKITIEYTTAAGLKKARKLIRDVFKEVDGLDKRDEKVDKMRGATDKYAKERAKFFEQAKAAEKNGDKEAAAKLRAKAKAAGEKMKKAEKDAAKKIFDAKNDNDPSTIDLHGLHVDEAVEFLANHLKKHKKSTILFLLLPTRIDPYLSSNSPKGDISDYWKRYSQRGPQDQNPETSSQILR